MSVASQSEDINSACMTAVANLMGKGACLLTLVFFSLAYDACLHAEKYNIPWEAVGRLEVGTESLVDKSKVCTPYSTAASAFQ